MGLWIRAIQISLKFLYLFQPHFFLFSHSLLKCFPQEIKMVKLLNAIFNNLNKYIDCLSFQDKSFLNENHRRKAIGIFLTVNLYG